MCMEESGSGTTLGDLLKAAANAEKDALVQRERERVVKLALAALIVENSIAARELRADGSEAMARALETENLIASEMLSGKFVLVRN